MLWPGGHGTNRYLNANILAVERAGWVLTGGASSRMGFDKALAEIEGRAMAALVAETAAKVCEMVSLVGDPARYGGLGLPVIPDNFPGCGPLAGMEAALGATTGEWNLIVACDMPALDMAVLTRLFAEGADCAVPQYEDGMVEPLCAVYHRRCHSAIRAALEGGVRKVTDALGMLQAQALVVRYVRVEQRDAFANLNTTRDLADYQRKQHG